jgi:UDP-GlcNAc:undecaprenyl-phosphate GlcNAc-1-phosphate transferase
LTTSAFFSHLGFAAALFALAAVLTWVMARLVRVMDVPSVRSSHARPVPKSGGVAIVTAFAAGSLVVYSVADIARISDLHFWGFLLCAILLAIVSFVDDVTQRSFAVKVAAQVVCVVAMLTMGVKLSLLYVPLAGEMALGWLGYLLTFLWIVGLTNAYNFMDGLDGLAGGVGVIAAVFLGAIALWQHSNFVYLMCYVLAASTAGFLLFNLPPARIFMGDVGSAFLGFTFASFAVIGANLDAGHLPFYVVPLLLFHFIFDTFFTFVRRALRGEPVLLAHRTHLYQLLNQTGFSHGAVALYHCAVTAAQGVGAVVLVNLDLKHRMYVFVPFLAYQTMYAAWVMRRSRMRGIAC